MASVEEIADAMFEVVNEGAGVKKYKASDLSKAMLSKYGDETSKADCKLAIRQLIESGRCVYTYFGGSFIEVPHKEGAAND